MNKILFAGTPDIAVPLLKALSEKFNVVGVLTSCDKMQGRSSALVAPPVKVCAQELGIPVLQFESIRTEAREAVKQLGADTLVTFAFGKIFGPKFLELFPNGKFNVHPSALPVFRGPSPIQATILSQLKTASISLQDVGLKMDEGDIWKRYDFELSGAETTSGLTDLVSQKAAEFVPQTLSDIFEGKIKSVKQSGEASYCQMLGKEDSALDFSKPAAEVHAKIRAMYPWPKTNAKTHGNTVTIASVWGGFKELDEEPLLDNPQPGKVVEYRKDRGIGVSCSDKIIWLTALQLPGKKELDYKSFINGNSWILQETFE